MADGVGSFPEEANDHAKLVDGADYFIDLVGIVEGGGIMTEALDSAEVGRAGGKVAEFVGECELECLDAGIEGVDGAPGFVEVETHGGFTSVGGPPH